MVRYVEREEVDERDGRERVRVKKVEFLFEWDPRDTCQNCVWRCKWYMLPKVVHVSVNMGQTSFYQCPILLLINKV